MNILHVITSLRTGGAEHLLVDLLPRLQSQNDHVVLFVLDGSPTSYREVLESKGITIITSKIGGSVYALSHIWRLRKVMHDFDIIHAHNTSPQLFTAIANLWLDKRIVTTEHSTQNRRRGHAVWKMIDSWMYKQYHKIVCISEAVQTELIHHIPSISEKCVVIANGIDCSRFKNAVAAELPIKTDTNLHVGLMAAAFRWEKDQQTVIRAYSLLPEKYHLLLAGTGEDKRIENCRQLALSLGIQKRVHFLGNRDDIPELMKASDVIILSSHVDGFGLVAVEGMAAQRPVIASAIPGLGDVVKGAGVLFPHEDATALANEIEGMDHDPERAAKIAKLCAERAEEYDIAAMAARYHQLYMVL